MNTETLDRSGFYGPTVQAEYDWHETCRRDPLAMQRLMLAWGMPLGGSTCRGTRSH